MAKSSVSRRKQKPKKPYDGFPLWPHPSGRWCKKVRGRFHYFGPWSDPEGALERFNREWPYLSDGRTPPSTNTSGACTMRTLCNSFLTSKAHKLEAVELSRRSFGDYHVICQRLIDEFGRDRPIDDIRSDGFRRFRAKLAKTMGPVALGNTIVRCRSAFKFAHDEQLINHPVHFGQSFDKPSATTLRRARHEAGPKMFEADELRKILDAADPIMRAMILLAANCGFGNSDVANLPISAVDFENGWVEFPRPKTAVERRCPLWAETVAALREALARRPEPKDEADIKLCFISKRGGRIVRTKPGQKNESRMVTVNTVSPAFARLLKNLDINGRKGRNFYALRHTFETIGGESKDQVAVNAIMGHVDSSMAATYRERISDERLKAVTDVVHAWLFGNAE